MANQRSVIYWDTSVFLAYLSDDATHMPTLDALLEEVSKSGGRHVIVTSVVSKVEVAFTQEEAQKRAMRPEVEAAIDALWTDTSVFELVELHDEIALSARKFIRDAKSQGLKLKPMDAIHLATAKWIGASALHTYDLADFKKFERVIGIAIVEPFVIQPKLLS
jgi:predicted nucleic acid-binding protein